MSAGVWGETDYLFYHVVSVLSCAPVNLLLCSFPDLPCMVPMGRIFPQRMS